MAHIVSRRLEFGTTALLLTELAQGQPWGMLIVVFGFRI